MSAPQSPFVGLAAFTPRMSAYLTGRERFALTLAGAVLRSRATALFGQSGCGKSSVLGAALPQAMHATFRRAAATTRAHLSACCISGAGIRGSRRGCFPPPQQNFLHRGARALPLPSLAGHGTKNIRHR